MDLKTSNYFHHLPEGVEVRKENPFHDSSETTDLVKFFPMANKTNLVEAPSTPGRPVFSFSIGSRKNFPSKWDDAQKWLPDSPVHAHVSKHSAKKGNPEASTEQKVVPKAISVYPVPTMDQDHHHKQHFNALSPSHVLLKDKITNVEEHEVSRFKCVVPIKDGFVMKDASTEVKRRDTGCPTPYRSVSPPRHTTPAMSGPLALSSSFDIADLHGCHLAKLELEGTCNWSSREEEEEDVSKSLRHNECPKTIPPCAWEQEQNVTSDLRYQREEAKIQAWVNLQNAKAEAQSRKLEVKIQKMRSKFEEKMMKKMASVHRKAEELRAAARYDHNMQRPKSDLHYSGSCGCFPCHL